MSKYYTMCIILFFNFFSSCTSGLSSRANPENFFSGAYLPIGEAIHKGKANDIKKLLEQQELEIDAVGEGGQYGKPTFLMYAVMIEKPEIVKTILELGANPTLTNEIVHNNMTVRDREGNIIRYTEENALTWASQVIKNVSKAKKIIKFLVDHGADINGFGDYYSAPLNYAFMSHDGKDTKELVDFLLANGANINAYLDKGGRTITSLPFTTGQRDMIDYLLDRGADPSILDFTGWDMMWYIHDRLTKGLPENKSYYEKLKNRLIKDYGMQYPPIQQKERGKELRDSMYKVMGIEHLLKPKNKEVE